MAAGMAIAGFSGAIQTGSIQGAFTGAAYGAVSGGLANQIGHGALFEGVRNFGKIGQNGSIGKWLAHRVSQGGISQASGGSFRAGFWGGFVGDASAGLVQAEAVPGEAVGRTMAAATLGGTAAVLGGGKFANGATTAAFVHLFNDEVARLKVNTKKIEVELESFLKVNADTDGNFTFSGDIKALSFTVGENGEISGNISVVEGVYQLEKGLQSLGLDVAGTKITFSNFQPGGVADWAVTTPNEIFGYKLSGFMSKSWSGVINLSPTHAARHNGILAPYYDKLHNLDLRCGGCGL